MSKPDKPSPKHQWCVVHQKWEDPAEWMECDDSLHKQGFRNVSGVIVAPSKPQPPANLSKLKLNGIGRSSIRTLELYYNRSPTNDEMTAIHEHLRAMNEVET